MAAALRTARAWGGVRPTEFLRLTSPGGPWNGRDRVLAQALDYLDAATPDHGVPGWIATHPAWSFTVEQGLDQAARAREEAIAKARDRKGANMAGATFTVTAKPPPEQP